MKLLVRPQMYEDESYRGYIWRLAAANGLAAVEPIKECLDLNDVSKFCPTPFPLLNISPRFLLVTHFRYCSACWNDKPYFRHCWDYALMPVCPKHFRPLIQLPIRIPAIIWKEKYTVVTPDNSQLSPKYENRQRLTESIVSTISGRENEFLTRLCGTKSVIEINQLFELILILGSYGQAINVKKPRKVKFRSDSKKALGVFDTAAEIMANWPQSLDALLPCPTRETLRSRELEKHLSYFFCIANKELKQNCFKKVKETINNYVISTWPDAIDAKRRKNLGFEQNNLLTGTTVSSMTGISLHVLKFWILNKRITGYIRQLSTGKEQVTIPRSELSKIRSLESPGGLCAVSLKLGIPKRTFKWLIESGYVNAWKTTVCSPWTIPDESVEHFREKLVSITTLEKESSDLVSITEAARYHCDYNHHQWDIYSAILNKELSGYRHVKNLQRFSSEIFVSKSELMAWQSVIGMLSITEVAKALHIKQEVAYQLVNRGLIEVVEMGRQGRHVSQRALRSFKGTYVFLRDLAKVYGTSSKSLLDQLSRLHIVPVTGPAVDGDRQYVFLRADID